MNTIAFKERELRINELKFCHELISCGNAEEAHLAAFGYSQATHGYSRTGVLLRDPRILLKLHQLREGLEARYAAERDLLVAELMNVVMADHSDFCTWSETGMVLRDSKELTKAELRRVNKVVIKTGRNGESTVSVELRDRDAAIEKLMRMMGLYETAQQQVTQWVIQVPAPAASSEAWEAQAQALASRTIEHEDKE
jgi:hypothetical protein